MPEGWSSPGPGAVLLSRAGQAADPCGRHLVLLGEHSPGRGQGGRVRPGSHGRPVCPRPDSSLRRTHSVQDAKDAGCP